METRRNDSFLAGITGAIDSVPTLRLFDGEGDYDLYPVSIFRQERDLFNRVRIRRYKSQLALPQEGHLVVRPGTTFTGKVLRTEDMKKKDGPFALARFRSSTIFWITGLELTQTIKPFDAASPKPSSLPLKTRIVQAFRRATESGKWFGTPLDLGNRPSQQKPSNGSSPAL